MKLEKIDFSLDPRDILLEEKYLVKYPQEFSLVDYDVDIENQLNINSCVANATCSALELMTLIYDKENNTNYFKNLSRLYVYYFLRKAENFGLKNIGTYLKDGFKVVNKFGVCDEDDFSYVESNIYKDIPQEIVEKARNRKCNKYRRIPNIIPNYTGDLAVHYIKSTIYQKIPVVFGMRLYKDFYNLKGNQLEETIYNCDYKNYIGNHAMLIVGYNKTGFIVENSWGENWGYKGRFILPYEAFKKNVFDAWCCIDYQDKEMHITLDKPKPKEEKEINLIYRLILFFRNLFNMD